jgi:hypothetical protein
MNVRDFERNDRILVKSVIDQPVRGEVGCNWLLTSNVNIMIICRKVS